MTRVAAQEVLDMFPTPAGICTWATEAYALGDVIARYWVRGSTFNPIGWDAFGLPAENAAIRAGQPEDLDLREHRPARESMRRYACSFDWDRTLNTCDPEYYHWNQWLFLKMFEAGLAYRKDSLVNWCPNDQTVLANEQVVNGRCERCDAVVTKKKLDPVVSAHHRLRGAPARTTWAQLEGKGPTRS